MSRVTIIAAALMLAAGPAFACLDDLSIEPDPGDCPGASFDTGSAALNGLSKANPNAVNSNPRSGTQSADSGAGSGTGQVPDAGSTTTGGCTTASATSC